jgi:integrase
VSEVTTAKRLLKAIMNTAVEDGVIRRNPCRIKGASQEKSPARPALTVAQVYALATEVGPRYRALVLVAAFGSLRWGEAVALRRQDFDADAFTVRVERQLVRNIGGGAVFGPPKSGAGIRSVPLPRVLADDLARQLKSFAGPGEDGLIFTGPAGLPLRHGNFYRRVWRDAVTRAGLEDVHFRDLRHAGNTFTADAGANLRELMARMGHTTTRAAMIDLHSTDERQRALADVVDQAARAVLGQAAKGARKGRPGKRSGTEVARQRRQAS